MTKHEGTISWRAGGASVRGASHVRVNAPNQDAIGWHIQEGETVPAIVAIADGHGSPAYVRSHIGARLAVETAIEVLLTFARDYDQPQQLSSLNRMVADQMPRTMVRSWQDRVVADFKQHPLSCSEKERLSELVLAKMEADPNTTTIYGSTLLAALVTRTYMLLWQLGDGDVLTVTAQAEVHRPPLPVDWRLLANQTTSMCMPDAWQHVRTYVQPFSERAPTLIMLATDGYVNSFAAPDGFLAAAADLLKSIQGTDFDSTCQLLPDWLETTSRLGSGDDISVGLLYGAAHDPVENA